MASEDDRIKADVLAELGWDRRLQPDDLEVSVEDGVVTLRGWVDSFMRRWAADRSAFRVHGVRSVANLLEVRLSPSTGRSDAEIAAAAALALAGHDRLSTIDLGVRDGVITLSGSVDWYFQRCDAERKVREVCGVKDVVNNIAVRGQSVIARLTQHIHEGPNPDEHERREADGPPVPLVADLARGR